jgi:diketogulonate reductase-like aldo/keto reductase
MVHIYHHVFNLRQTLRRWTTSTGIGGPFHRNTQLAWLLAQKPFIVPIPGTRSVDHLQENLRAVDVQLTPADLREIETALSKIEVHGGRMNEERMKVVDQTE